MSGTAHVRQVDGPWWQRHVTCFADYSYRQSWAFGVACAERVGAISEHVAIEAEGDLVGLADVRIKRMPVLGVGVAYVNGGPLIRRREGDHADRLAVCLGALRYEYVEGRGLVLRVMPPVRSAEENARTEQVFRAAGFRPGSRPPAYRTRLVDISPSLEVLRKNLAQKWRNCLNRAEKNDLATQQGTDPATFGEFCELYEELIGRKGFEVDLDAAFYAGVQQDADEADRFVVMLAKAEGAYVSGVVASILGDTCVYVLGATNSMGMQTKASYLLQWNTIVTARERGCLWYDLGGVDPEGNPGVYHFKKGVGGDELTAPGPFEAVPGTVRRIATLSGEKAYLSVTKGIRRIRRRLSIGAIAL